ncbi:MAG: transcription termination factor Rho [Phycisphaerae bacterium SM23_33]|nr:MAG: transcription termination factor Rho [Phycisphaerae bacterium SM23_33]
MTDTNITETAQQQVSIASGVLEITEKGYGFLRQESNDFRATPGDVFISKDFVGGDRLRTGLFIEGEIVPATKKKAGPRLQKILRINGKPYNEWPDVVPFSELIAVDPHPQMPLETRDGPVEMRVLDLVCPLGKGQRGLIVASPRTGKTILLQQIANAILANCPGVHVIVLLVDERPEEVTDFKRKVAAEIVHSTNDQDVANHVRVAEFTIERAKRMTEFRRDVIILLDSLTRLGRAYNRYIETSGRTMTGGVDIRALETPKRLFGAARNVETGGSLTILATALIETGSRMDDLIFEEFKGTGNMELMLDRQLAEKRIWPAVDISRSGTRKEELLYEPWQLPKIHMLRRFLSQLNVDQAMPQLLRVMSKFKTNEEFLRQLDLSDSA